jgi:valyl-tRNA synthetase
MPPTPNREPELPKTYSPDSVEGRLYEWWEAQGYFQPSDDPTKKPFVITIPPPNVTGELHLGHVLTYSIEDILGRYKRMCGFATLVLPGMDHASIAVHAKLEAQLAEQGIKRRFDVGRERFMELAWEWKEKYRAEITRQFRALGESYDWSRQRFTMDPGYYRAVMTMFVQLYDEGFIYRGSRVINWCPECRTGISDLEVRNEEREDSLYYVRLPFSDRTGEIVVATVRPETMFGDVAVAVHPNDARYASAVGKHVIHPLTGAEIPVIADEFVDPKFGTGAVKITPAHDYADFEVGERHDLPMPVVITPHATMADDVAAPYAGIPVLEARAAAIEQLTRQGDLVRAEPLIHNVPLCDRSGTVIEPLLSEQWFMRMKELAQPAIDAVTSGRVRFVPERWGRIYLDWMENIRPWNISRQLWWGQRIPIYHCANGHISASVDRPQACPECGSTELEQDPDVFDTWFSSALWPFATLGWPDKTADLERFYPTSFMNTSSQILYLWIARMIMMGIHFMGDIPFPIVLINPTILNEKGQRMSKSLGTGIDPMETVKLYGADATRFGVFSAGSIVQQEIRIAGYERAADGQRFANKIWNVARFVLQSMAPPGDGDVAETFNVQRSTFNEDGKAQLNLSIADRWILGRIDTVTTGVTGHLEDDLDLTAGLRSLYDFLWSEFADWYVEIAKQALHGDDDGRRDAARAVLWSVLDRSMRLLHPYMPFITEEVWQHLRRFAPAGALGLSGLQRELPDSIMIAPWPRPSHAVDAGAEAQISQVMELVTALRNLRATHKINPKAPLSATAVVRGDPEPQQELFTMVKGLAYLSGLTVERPEPPPLGGVAEVVSGEITLSVPISELTNVEEEIARVERELAKSESESARIETLLANPNFVAKAPPNVVAREREKLDQVNETALSQKDQLRRLREGT